MDKLDQMIEEALSEEDRAIVAETAQRSFMGEFFGQLYGRDAWVKRLLAVSIFLYVALGLWAGWKFLFATEALFAVKYGLVALLSFTVIGLMKMYLFSEMQSDRIMRELKRLELMMAARDKG